MLRINKMLLTRALKKLRIKKWPTLILGPVYTTDHQRIEINITFDCNLKCLNCNRSCSQAPSEDHMSIGQIDKFIKESRKKNRKWSAIRIIGGESTTHPCLFEILEMLVAYNKECGNGFKLVLVTNGFGEKTKEILSKLPQGVLVENSNKKAVIQEHFYSFNVAPVDLKEFKNIDYSNKCVTTAFCGLGLSKYGYYICSLAAGIDRVLGSDIGRKELPDVDDQMTDQALLLCKYCGRFRIRFNYDKKGGASPSWQKIYEKYAKQKPYLREY